MVSMYTPQESEFVLSNLKNLSIHQMAQALHKERKSLFTFLRNRKISIEDYPNLMDVPLDTFRNVTLPETAYLLGFIWADGHIHIPSGGIIIDCVKEDMDALEGVFDKTGVWRKHQMNRKDKRTSRIFRTYNRSLANYLCSKDYGRKSEASPDLILETIPDNLKHYFWRGYFDGDGCVYIDKKMGFVVSMAGSYKQDWTALALLGNQLNIEITNHQRKHGKSVSSSMFIRTKHHGIKFLNWIYDGFELDNIGLSRKFDKVRQARDRENDRKISKDGYIGVTKTKNGRFYAKITETIDGKSVQRYLGFYDDPVAAAKAYDAAAFKLRGNKVRVNFPVS